MLEPASSLRTTRMTLRVASIRVMEHVGMRREALFNESVFRKGEWASDAIYAILESAWRSRSPVSP